MGALAAIAVVVLAASPESRALEMPPPPRLASPTAVDVLPHLELSAGPAALWRSYEFCPGAVRCGQQVFVGPEGLKFVTDLPYLAGAARLVSFPFARGPAEAYRGLGLDARYARGAIQVGATDPQTQELRWSLAWDQSWSAEVLYRRQDNLFGLQPWVGVRLGAGARTFSVPDSGVEGTHSARRVGPIGGVEAGLPLLGAALRAELTARYALGLLPGPGEQAAFGGAVVSSDGFLGTFALAGTFGPSGLGWSAALDYQLYLDSFLGSGERASGGSVREQYLSLTTSLRYRF